MSLRLAFMGTPEFATGCLSEIAAAGHEIAAVYTQPPRPAGRGQSVRRSPVHELAEALGLDVRTPEKLGAPDEIAAFQALDLDAAVVVAYGQILKRAVLNAPRLGCFNVHASLLPRWRGAAPIQRAIMAGDEETGVQIMRMEPGLDTGPVLLAAVEPIRGDDTAASLHDRLAALGAQILPQALAAIARGSAVETPQADHGVTYAHKIDKGEARLSWSAPGDDVDRKIRGLSPFPGAWFESDSAKGAVRVKALMSARGDGAGAPGQILAVAAADGLTIACGRGAVRLITVQREGRRPQSGAEFAHAAGLKIGDFIASGAGATSNQAAR